MSHCSARVRDLVLMIYKYFLRELLFLADPEKAHGLRSPCCAPAKIPLFCKN